MANAPYQRPDRLLQQTNRDELEGIGPLAVALGALALVVIITIAMVIAFAF